MTAVDQIGLADSFVRSFDGPDDLRRALAILDYAIKVNEEADFRVRLTRAQLNSVVVLGFVESSSGEALLAAPDSSILIVLPTEAGIRQYWCGIETNRNDIVVGRPGEMLSHKTCGPCQWSCALLSLNSLIYWRTAVLGRGVPLPEHCQHVRPQPAASRKLRQITREACRLVENDRDAFAHPEIQRSLEQEFILALLNALSKRVS